MVLVLIVFMVFSLVAIHCRNSPFLQPFLWLKLAIPLSALYMKSSLQQYSILHKADSFLSPSSAAIDADIDAVCAIVFVSS